MLNYCVCGGQKDELASRHQQHNEPLRLPRLARRLSILLPRFYGLPADVAARYGDDFEFVRQGMHSDIYQSPRFVVRGFALRRIRSPYLRDFSIVSAATNRPVPLEMESASRNPHPCRLHEAARLLTAINHPNIVRLIDLISSKTYICTVSERLSGPTLPDCLSELETSGQVMTEEQMCDVFRQMVAAVSHLHDNGFVHRHLSSHKFVFNTNTLVLVDFVHMVQLSGNANIYQENLHGTDDLLVGSPYYQAPEVLMERKWSTASDVWALGVLFYEVIFSGCMPFFARKVSELRRSILHAQPEISDEEVSPVLKALVETMLIKEPLARPTLAAVAKNDWMMNPGLAAGDWKRRPSPVTSLRLPSRRIAPRDST